MNKTLRIIAIIRFYLAIALIIGFVKILSNYTIPPENVTYIILSNVIGLIIPISFIAYLINTGINEFKNRESNSKWLTLFGIIYEVGLCILIVYFFNYIENFPISAKILLIINALALFTLTINDIFRNFKGLIS